MAKTARRRTVAARSTAADRPSTVKTDAATHVTELDIARRAHDLYVARNGEHGHDLDDWLQAERDLQTPRSTEC